MTNIQAWLRENWVGIAGVIVVVLGFWWFTNKEERQGLIEPEGLMVGEEVSLLEEKTGLKVMGVGEKIVLENVNGTDASGIATKESILADLPDEQEKEKIRETKHSPEKQAHSSPARF